MHSFCMVARVINISPLCSGWGLPTGNGLYATLRAPRQPSRSLYPQYCFDNPHFTCLPRICHNQWMCQWIIIYALVIRVWKWRKVLARLWSIADQMEQRYLRSKHRIEMDRVNLYYWIFNNDESKYFFLIFHRLILIDSKFNKLMKKNKKSRDRLQSWRVA